MAGHHRECCGRVCICLFSGCGGGGRGGCALEHDNEVNIFCARSCTGRMITASASASVTPRERVVVNQNQGDREKKSQSRHDGDKQTIAS